MRVRFAPSPTGALHIGGARTALYNWLLARGQDGTLVLRIEDTDRERSTPENVEQILDALRWLNLDYDEGPIFQSERADRHRDVLQQLLDDGHAYHSSATGDDVKAYKQRHGVDRGFRGEPEESGAIRLRYPTRATRSSTTSFAARSGFPMSAGRPRDRSRRRLRALQLRSRRRRPRRRRDSRRSWRGPPLQHAEAAARIRGAGRGTCRGMRTCRCCTAPTAASCQSDTAPRRFRSCATAGYLPEAVDNYIALLGAGFAADEELFTTGRARRALPARTCVEEPAVFDERKLRHMNGRYLRELSVDELTEQPRAITPVAPACAAPSRSRREKIQTLADFWPLVGVPVRRTGRRPQAFEKVIAPRRRGGHAAAARDALASADPFTLEQCRSGAARSCRVHGGEAGPCFPTGTRRDRGHDRVARDLRERRAAGP